MSRRSIMFLIVGAFLLLFQGQAIAQDATPAATPDGDFDMTAFVWEMVEIQTGPDTSATPDDPARYTVRFFEDGVVAIMADCNAGRGEYTVDGSSIEITMGAMTMALCPEDSLSDQFVADLDQVATFVVNDAGELVLSLPADAGFLRFQPSLTGVIWQWTELLMMDGTVITPDDPARYTIEFLPEQQFLIQADCNQGSGTYTRTGAKLDLSVDVLTRAACPPDSLSEDFIGYLNDAVTVTFENGQIHLALPVDSGILTFSPQPFMPTETVATPDAG